MSEKNSVNTQYIHSPVCRTCVEFVGSVLSVALLEDLLMEYNKKPKNSSTCTAVSVCNHIAGVRLKDLKHSLYV